MLYRANPTKGSLTLIEGQAHPEDTAHSVEAIRNLIRSEKNIAPQPPLAAITPDPAEAVVPDPAPAPEQVAPDPAPTPRNSYYKTSQTLEPDVSAPPASNSEKPARQRGFQPSWRLSGIILVLAIFVWNPWVLPSLTLLLLAITAILYFSLGPDRVGAGIARWHARLHRRNPDRAEALRKRAATWSARLERRAALLPAGWTDGLYFPSFEPDETPSDMTCDPFDRLAPRAPD